MYPHPDKVDPVAWDKSTFNKTQLKLATTVRSGKGSRKNLVYEDEKKEAERRKTNEAVRFLSCDPGVRYSSNFRQKNMNNVRELHSKTNTHVQALAWSTGLRPDNHKLLKKNVVVKSPKKV